jgi:hypothetical protein
VNRQALMGNDAGSAVQKATEAVQTTSRSIADAGEAGKAAIGHERANR